jgi:uncharacterized membrane protein YjjP (DUF1212 family)
MARQLHGLVLTAIILGAFLAASLISRILANYFLEPWAKFIGFFSVGLVVYVLLRRQNRLLLWQGVALCVLAGLIALISATLWPSH